MLSCYICEVRRLQKENSQLKNGEIPEVFEM
nr:MAG TPA: vimentin [Crassvirales sp.]